VLPTPSLDRRVRRRWGTAGASCGATPPHMVGVTLMVGTQAELGNHDTIAAPPMTCGAEEYVSLGGKT